jgi:hypothetical protein
LGLGLGLLAALVGWFVVAPFMGQPVAGGFAPRRMPVTVLIRGAWGIGVGLLLPLLLGRRTAARARPAAGARRRSRTRPDDGRGPTTEEEPTTEGRRVAPVTGAAPGIGLATAARLGRARRPGHSGRRPRRRSGPVGSPTEG